MNTSNGSHSHQTKPDCDHNAPHSLQNDGQWYCTGCGDRVPDPPTRRYTGCDAELDTYRYEDEYAFEIELARLSALANDQSSASSSVDTIDDDSIPF